MGMFDNFRNLFKGSSKAPVAMEEDSYKKSMLATQIVNLVDKIKRKNSFDSSIWNLNNISSSQLERRSLAELEGLKSTLDSKLSELTRQSQRKDQRMESLEASKWTGQKPKGLTDHEFDRFQRDESR